MSSRPKIVFIINSIQQQRCLKRIEEFIDNGYEVEAYGFSRSETIPTQPKRFTIQVLDTFSAGMSYATRFVHMLKALRPVMKKYKHEQVIYYYFLLDVAMAARLLSSKPYIYEESDLMQAEMGRPLLCRILDKIDRWLIRHSLLTVMTSEGFIEYHYGKERLYPIVLVPNRLNADILHYPMLPKEPLKDTDHLRFAFVGNTRYQPTLTIARTIAEQFPQHSFHFYGRIMAFKEDIEALAQAHDNVVIHGPFSNPRDLPLIYHDIDILICTYDDVLNDNLRYAEANKLYDAIYFETPIAVAAGTHMAQQVERLKIGYVLSDNRPETISAWIRSLTISSLHEKQQAAHAIDKSEAINHNPQLFTTLNQRLS